MDCWRNYITACFVVRKQRDLRDGSEEKQGETSRGWHLFGVLYRGDVMNTSGRESQIMNGEV